MSDKKTVYCNFCGKSEHEVDHLISGPSVAICNECTSLCVDLIQQKNEHKDGSTSTESIQESSIKTPQEIYAFLNEHVVGQGYAKKVLSVAAYNHYKRLGNLSDDTKIDKSNILLIGPTGCGKTLLAETLARFLDVPIAITDATTLTEAGYVGEDVQNVVKRLVQKADGDIQKAQRGIIFIDEIDKISRKSENPSITKDVGGEGVQQALLKLIEGTIVTFGKEARKNPQEAGTDIDTSQILFICSGAFQGIEDLVNKRENSHNGIGLTASIKDKNKEKSISDAMKSLEPEDLVKFGLIPEFVGRLPVIASLTEVDKETLVKILTEPKNSLVNQYKKLFNIDGVELEFQEDALDVIADKAIKRKTGARGLRSIVENTLMETMFKSPSIKDLQKVVVTKSAVLQESDPDLIYKEKSAA